MSGREARPERPPATQRDEPEVAAALGEVRRAWNFRLLMACLTMTAIVAFFLIDLWNDPRMAESVAPILLCYLALAFLFFLVVRWVIARETAAIRRKAGRPAP